MSEKVEQKHTPEPWFAGPTGMYVEASDGERFILAHLVHNRHVNKKANAHRIVQCVNAMAGIPDPQAALDEVKNHLIDIIASDMGDPGDYEKTGNEDDAWEHGDAYARHMLAKHAREALQQLGERND